MRRDTLGSGGGTGITVLNRVSKAWQHMLGADYGSVGASGALGGDTSIVDYMDFNGDRYPDLLNTGTIQYTNPAGGLQGAVPLAGQMYNDNSAYDLGGGGSIPIIKPYSKGHTDTGSNAENTTQMPYLGLDIRANIGGGVTEPTSIYQDMNGDGLPDLVTLENGTVYVQLNTGYGFLGEKEAWGSGRLNKGGNQTYGLGLNLGYNYDNYSFAGGVSASKNDTKADEILTDMNGDGLPDYVRKETGGNLTVRTNTGSGFGVEQNWGNGFDRSLSESTGYSIGGGVYFTIAIPAWILRIIINPGVSGGVSMGRLTAGLRDVNADGCPDWVISGADDELRVKYNKCGRTNLLRRVDEPLGGASSLSTSGRRRRRQCHRRSGCFPE